MRHHERDTESERQSQRDRVKEVQSEIVSKGERDRVREKSERGREIVRERIVRETG